MTPQTIAWVVALGFVLLAIREIPFMPKCPFCGKTREHAKDCSTRR